MNWRIDLTESFAFRPWRLLTIFYLLPGVFGTLLLIKLPESPKILISMGKTEDAFAAVNWISLKNSGKQLQDLKVKMLKFEEVPDRENGACVSKSA